MDSAYEKFKTLHEGKNADYIPALAKVDPNLFGIALVTADGKVYTAGDVETEVSIQSISKVFTMAQVIEEQGLESIEKRIGVDATGARFNSIIAVEGVRTVVGSGAPEMNPLVNPGAISATSMVRGATSDDVWKKIGIAVVSPPLDDAGNSVRAQRAFTAISNALGGNPYAKKAGG